MNKTALLNNRYQIIQTLGRGGFGETSLAIDTHLPSGKKCVIKLLKPIIHEPQIPVWMQERFSTEARILEHLGEECPQIPRLYAYFSEADNFYLVQEFIEGVTLTQKLDQEGTLSQTEVQKILINLLEILDYVHNQRIVHRDIKPDNIILRSSNNQPVLIDFGAVKEAMATIMTSNGNSAYSVAIGTPGYMASEQAAGRPIYSSDLYSLALTGIYLLTGKSPQYLKTDSRTGEIVWREAAPNIHSNLASVLDKAIRFHPKDRFATAKEMLTALQPTNFITTPISVKSRKKEDDTTEFTNQKTIAVNVASFKEEDNNWFKTLLPLIILSGIALSSFIFGFNVLLNSNKTSKPEISTQPQEQSPLVKNTNPTPVEKPKPNIVNVQPQPETKPPEVVTEPTPENIETPITETIEPETPITQNTVPQTNTTETKNSTSIAIPVVMTGTSETDLISKLGQPTSQTEGYWPDSVALLYKDFNNNPVDLGYILQKDTRNVRQTEASFDSSLDLVVMENTLSGLLGGNATPEIKDALKQVYQRETDLRSFNLDNFKVMIQRNDEDRIYIGVWDADFH